MDESGLDDAFITLAEEVDEISGGGVGVVVLLRVNVDDDDDHGIGAMQLSAMRHAVCGPWL
jgi:hypothetical protein